MRGWLKGEEDDNKYVKIKCFRIGRNTNHVLHYFLLCMNMLSKFKLLLYKKFKFICYYIIHKGKIIPFIYYIEHWTDEKHALKKVYTMNTKC